MCGDGGGDGADATAGELRDGAGGEGSGDVIYYFFGVVGAISRTRYSADIFVWLEILDYLGVKKKLRRGFSLVPTLHPQIGENCFSLVQAYSIYLG